MKKKIKIGYIIGRFNPLHLSHTTIIDKMVEENDYIIILIGSANVSREKENPLTYSERAHILTHLYPNAIVLPLNDYGDLDDWIQAVDYKINDSLNILNLNSKEVEINLYTGGANKGNDAELRQQWCKPLGHNVVPVHLDNDLSATIIRDHYYNDNMHLVKEHTPEKVYSFLREFQKHEDYKYLTQ